MRRAAAIAVAVALVLTGMALLPLSAAQLQPGEATAAECTWKRQVKRIVKRVRRDGKLRRVVRRKVRWVCVPQAAPPLAPAPTPTPPPPAPPVEEPEPEANRLAVKASEYFYVLSRPSVRAGEVTIELNNRGEDPHNLNLREEGGEGTPHEVPETDSLQRNVSTFDLPAGNYRLWCSLPEHEERGMYTELVVE
ncbi:MAG TPA: plastocyanin/azurin family copper-binding protein [Solirubrobacterales bacterium]|nr:plastocyanin/azurin family copper-binding protein [Solirubrobacterales bacterium]